MKIKTLHYSFLLILAGILTSLLNSALAQSKHPYVRIAKIVVDSNQVENYNAALKEHAEAAVSKERGVLTLYAVYDNERPTNVTVFEIYASVPAYQSHIQTTHFLKYKDTVKDVLNSLVLTDVVPIALETMLKK